MKARIGVIGCGWWATRAHLPALKANPDAVIAGDRRPGRGEPRARRRALRHPRRPGLRRRAEHVRRRRARRGDRRRAARRACAARARVLDRGLHLLLEKPMTISPPDARALAALGRASAGSS